MNPIGTGVNACVDGPVVIISAITPEPGNGSAVSCLPESNVLAVDDVYTVTQAATLVCIFNNA